MEVYANIVLLLASIRALWLVNSLQTDFFQVSIVSTHVYIQQNGASFALMHSH